MFDNYKGSVFSIMFQIVTNKHLNVTLFVCSALKCIP